VLLGTRFYAAQESLAAEAAKRLLAEASGDRTARGSAVDIARGIEWPAPYTLRTLRNDFVDRWQGREAALRPVAAAEARRYGEAQQAGDFTTAAVIAGPDAAARAAATAALASPGFRLYGNQDAIGAQLGGAAKNVIAIAAGAVIGAGLGENARAALITRGLAELARLAAALGGRAETMSGLSGLGDLLLTCTGPASRNFSLGLALGQGRTLAAVLAERHAVTEGVTTAPALLARADGVDLPICRAVAALLAGEVTLEAAIAALLARRRRDE
ncbi:MAG: NAD(P)H-dependent glycerol-3-phosphate dehydrogenase, partial [Acetobacteraceae bacterium]